jgi:predicted enzyme related to lactoylglutathione lyase
MATRTAYGQGEFAWTSLGTTDASAARRFYSGLFGWDFRDMPGPGGMTYVFCQLGGETVCGLAEIPPSMRPQVPPHWLPAISVANADDVVAQVQRQGGRVVFPAMDVTDAGRSAQFVDPTGANLSIWQAKRHAGATMISTTGAMCWNELMTPDTDAAARFYEAVFGWSGDHVPMPGGDGTYTIFKRGTTMVGGMLARPAELSNVPPHWLTYFGVADCDASAARATELGGSVLRSPTDIPDVGRFAVCRDGQGAVFAIARFNPPAQ